MVVCVGDKTAMESFLLCREDGSKEEGLSSPERSSL